MHVVFSKDECCFDGIEAEELDEYKLAGLLGMTVTEGPLLPGPILKGHWRGFTVEITVAPKPVEYQETVHMFPQPPEFQITFHLEKNSDVEIGIRHRSIEVTGLVRPPLIGKKKIMMPPEFGRDYLVLGPSNIAAKIVLDKGMQELIKRLEKFGPPELRIEYSLLKYQGIGNFVERYREIPTLLGNLVEIGRMLDGKLTIMLRDLG
ncbi:MAG: hypothetical protein NTY09_03215 [bacterium]|nr:hypothetical protein [bacterium]